MDEQLHVLPAEECEQQDGQEQLAGREVQVQADWKSEMGVMVVWQKVLE